MADYKPNRYFADGYFPDGYFGPRQTQAPVVPADPRGGLEQFSALGFGHLKSRQQLAREAARKKARARRTGVRHDGDDVIAILLALT